MALVPTQAEDIAAALLAASSDEERRRIAETYLAYALGALTALVGPRQASEIAYRHADAVVARR